MLTTLEANFVQEYKLNGGNAKEAVIKAGYNVKYPSAMGSQLLKKPKISKLISRLQERTDAILTQPCVAPVYLPPKIMELPSKQEYLAKAWSRTDTTDNSRKEETQVKYTELVGKGLGFIGREENNSEQGTFTIICRELNLNLPANDEALKVVATSATSVASDASVSSDTTSSPVPDNTAIEAPTHGVVIDAHTQSNDHEKISHSPAQVSEGPEGGMSKSVNPLPKSPTILNSVKKTKKLDKKKSVLEQEVMSFKPTIACEDNELSDN